MPYYPAAHVDLLPEATTQPAIKPRLVILHTNAGSRSTNGFELRKWMARDDVGLECHFQVDSDGLVHQFMPVNVRADCNAAANPFAVSIETQDRGAATVDSTAWTAEQGSSIVGLLRWLHDVYSVPLERCTRWDGVGVAGHRDFHQWSKSAHSCPGNVRWAQIPALIAAAAGPPLAFRYQGEFMDVIDASTDEFWRIYTDATGALVATPFSELPRQGDNATFGPIRDKVVGELVRIPHEWLQAMYDVQGKPSCVTGTPGPVGPAGPAGDDGDDGVGFHDHVHANVGQPTTTGGVTP